MAHFNSARECRSPFRIHHRAAVTTSNKDKEIVGENFPKSLRFTILTTTPFPNLTFSIARTVHQLRAKVPLFPRIPRGEVGKTEYSSSHASSTLCTWAAVPVLAL